MLEWTKRGKLLAAVAAVAGLVACGKGSGSSERPISPGDPPDGSAPPDAGTPPDAGDPPDSGPTFGGPGPWPTAPVTVFGAAQGLRESDIQEASTDEAQNIWVVSNSALYVLRPGETTFRRYTGADGLNTQLALSPGILAVAGGAENEAFVGYQGSHVTDPQTDPDRHMGKIDRVQLRADGTLAVTRFDVHNNDAFDRDANCNPIFLPDGTIDPDKTDWSFNENRTVYRFLYDHIYHRGNLYVGYNHGVGRIRADHPDPVHGFEFADHVHPDVVSEIEVDGVKAGTKRMGEWRGLALDPSPRKHPVTGEMEKGLLWMGGKWGAGGISWTPELWQWTLQPCRNPFYTAFSSGLFPVPAGTNIYYMGIAALTDGTVYFASGRSAALGIVGWRARGGAVVRVSAAQLGLPNADIVDMQALPDDTILIALGDSLWRWDPKPEPTGKLLGQLTGLPGSRINRLYVDWMVKPTAVYVATDNGFAMLRLAEKSAGGTP